MAGFSSPPERQQYARAVLSVASGSSHVVRPVLGPRAGQLGGLNKSNALIVVPPDTTSVAAGDVVLVMPLSTESDPSAWSRDDDDAEGGGW